jgi:hypothetical protein
MQRRMELSSAQLEALIGERSSSLVTIIQSAQAGLLPNGDPVITKTVAMVFHAAVRRFGRDALMRALEEVEEGHQLFLAGDNPTVTVKDPRAVFASLFRSPPRKNIC